MDPDTMAGESISGWDVDRVTTDALARLQDLLRELFQFENADLDFGIYRIMNYKRAEIRRFVEERLPSIV